MITSGVRSTASEARSAASIAIVLIGAEEPQVASHHTIAKPKASRKKKLAAKRWDHPSLLAKSFLTKLMPIAEQRHLATELEIRIGWQAVEASRRRTGQYVLAESRQHHPFQMFLTVLHETGDVELHDRADASIGRGSSAGFGRHQSTAPHLPHNHT